MISESASDHSNMSPSPPCTKSTKLDIAVKQLHTKTIKKEIEMSNDCKLADNKRQHSVLISDTKTRKVQKTSNHKSRTASRNDDQDSDDEAEEAKQDDDEDRSKDYEPISDNDIDDDEDEDADDEDEYTDRTRDNKLDDDDGSELDEHHNQSTNIYNKDEKNRKLKSSNHLETVSHKSKNKCPSDDHNPNDVGSNSTDSSKTFKKEKKRYQEMVIDGFTITAFRTWEHLQDEMNERISANIMKSAQAADDCDMPNTSCSSGTTSSLTANEVSLNSNHANNGTTSLLQPKQSSSGIAANNTSDATPEASNTNLNNHPSNSIGQNHVKDEHQKHMSGNINSTLKGEKRFPDRSDRRVDYDEHLSLLHKTLRQKGDHEFKNYHDKSQSREEYHTTIKMQSTRENPSSATRHQPHIPVNNSYPYADINYESLRASRPHDADAKRSGKPQYDQQHPFHLGHPNIPNSYLRRSPSPSTPIHPPPLPPSSQTAHQYFQYQQLYQQMQNSAHHQHQPGPHLQNPYLALMNQFNPGSHLKSTGPPPPPLAPPPPPMALPNPPSMMGPPPFNSPYTITDTIISRQTSIIPSNALGPMPGSLDHLASSRFGRHPHLNALEHSMAPSTFGHPGATSYMPTPTERSFMEFARSYANASNLSSGYNFMNQVAMPKNTLGPSNFYGHLDRMTMDQQHRNMIQGLGGGPNPFSGFNTPGRPPTISMFPPHYYP